MINNHPTLSRRVLLGGTAAAATAAGLTGLTACNDDTGGGGGASGTLNVWGGVPNETGPDDLCQAFMDANPGTTVTYTRFVNDEQGNLKLDTSLSGGVPIDVYFSYGPPPLYKRVDAGVAMDLTDKIEAEDDLKHLGANGDPLSNYPRDGKVYCIPAARAPMHVYMNKAMLDEAGITLPETWDLDDFVDIATELTRPDRFGTMTSPHWLARSALGPDYYYADGGARSNFGNEWFRKEMELSLKLQADKVAMDHETVLAEKLRTFSQTPFIAGRVAILVQAGQIIRSINDTQEYPHDFQTACMPLPSPEPGMDGWNSGQIGDLLSINPKTTNPDLAWEFTKFWVRNASKFMTRGGRLPMLTGTATEDDILADLLGPERETLYDVDSWKAMLFSDKLKLPVDTIYTAATEIRTIVEQLSDETLLGTRSVDSYITELTSQADAAIASATQ